MSDPPRIGAMAAALLAAATLTGASAAWADEPLFGYVYTTDLLPKGQKEVEQWTTFREGRAEGDFSVYQGRTEVSYGLTDNLQVSGYLNYAHADVFANTPGGETAPPEIFADYDVDPARRFSRWRSEGVSVEAIYRFLSPYTSPIGAAVYLEPTIGPNTRELETRLILQKNFHDDRLVIAFNTTIAQELRRVPGDPAAPPGSGDDVRHWDQETDVNFGLGGSYRFRPNWYLGLEFLNEREWAGFNPFDGASRTNVAYYLGPNVHFGGRHVFATLTVLAQLPWARDDANPAPGFIVNGFTDADDFERARVRFKLGYVF